MPVPDEPSPRYLVANVGDNARTAALELAVRLRRAGVGAILSSGSRGRGWRARSHAASFRLAARPDERQANALGIPYALILGDDEIAKGEVVVRDMTASTQQSRPLAEFLSEIAG